MFDEYKLLINQIESLAAVMNRMNTGPQGRQNQQNESYKHYIHCSRGRGHRNYPSYERVINRGRGNFRQRSNDRINGGYSSFRGN